MASSQPKRHSIIPKGLALKFNMQDIFDAILSDSLEPFQDCLGKINLNADFELLNDENEDIPLIFKDHPLIPHMCCLFNAQKCLNFAIEQGCDIQQPDFQGRHCIHFAAAGGDLDIIYKLAENGCTLDTLDKKRKNACHYAAQYNNLDVFNYLYVNNVDVNLRNNLGLSPLMSAAASDSIDVLQCLLDDPDKKININQQTEGIFLLSFMVFKFFSFLIGLLYIMPPLWVHLKQLNFLSNMVLKSI